MSSSSNNMNIIIQNLKDSTEQMAKNIHLAATRGESINTLQSKAAELKIYSEAYLEATKNLNNKDIMSGTIGSAILGTIGGAAGTIIAKKIKNKRKLTPLEKSRLEIADYYLSRRY